MISHEIRSPLTAILGWCHMLRQGGLEQSVADRALETIERNARTQVQLIEDLIDISRVTTGKLRLQIRPLEIKKVLKAALDSIRPAADAKSIKVDSHVKEEAILIAGDPDRLQQVFFNLLSNAVKFTPANGRVDVTLEHLGSNIQITVTDSGAGIRSDFLPYVFDRFTQADTTTARKHGGLGLGLAIVRHLVELHGGSVEAESAGEGKGASFTVRLPLRPSRQDTDDLEPTDAVATAPGISAESRMLEGIRILLVEDEAETRDLLVSMLTARGADVKACASTAEALETLEHWRPSVLVSDIGMPDEDGYSLIKKIRKLGSEQRNIPAVALTAYARAEDRMRVLASGFQMHVAKPVEALELMVVIASLAGRGATIV
jgi:CheY-like chemotaxis protein